jgi:hypothetical protein
MVAVIGRDATAAADADGRFTLALPPGTYSLVIGGPGLVPNQRVDDVAVVADQPHDLGTIEVWPEEPPPGCSPGAAAPPAPTVVVATAPDTPTVDLPGTAVAPAAPTPDQLWVRGGGGAGAGQFGLQGNPAHDDEDALGPPSFALGPQGWLWVLDALNSRVQRFDPRGHPVGGFALERRGEEPSVEEDIAVTDEGHLFLFHQNDVLQFSEYDASGRFLFNGALPPSFKGVDLLFAARAKPLFLMLNGQAVRAELGWGGVRAEGLLPGLPVGGLYVRADREDRWRVVLTFAGADGRVRRSIQFRSFVPVTGVRLVGVGRRGEIVLAVDRSEAGEDSTPRAEVLLLSLDQHGHLAGTADVPPGNRRFQFREFAVAADGAVVQMQSDATEVRFVRWTLHHPPPTLLAGEGLVRGRILEGGKTTQAAVVAINGRQRRNVAVAGDGSFELRLPAGTWVVSIRKGGPNVFDPAPVEIKVAVAAGATVDVGTVSPTRTVPRPPGPPAPSPAVPPGSDASALGLP